MAVAKVILGQRTAAPAHFDLRCGGRMGDFACIHVFLKKWRQRFPDRKLVLAYNEAIWRSIYGKTLLKDWVFGFVDELWLTAEPVPLPGENLTPAHIWDEWHLLRGHTGPEDCHLPPESLRQQARQSLSQLGVPLKFITLHPLMDAGYHSWRNGKREWWNALFAALDGLPVVALGPYRMMATLVLRSSVFSFWRLQTPPMDNLAVISLSQVHVGGETGFTLWAPLFGVPTIAVYRHWATRVDKRHVTYDYRPLSFGRPVIWGQLEGDPLRLAQVIKDTFSGQTESTPP